LEEDLAKNENGTDVTPSQKQRDNIQDDLIKMMDDEVPKISMFEPYGADTAKPDQDTQKAPGFEALVAL